MSTHRQGVTVRGGWRTLAAHSGWVGCTSVADAVRSLLSDPLFNDSGQLWTVQSVADELLCSTSPVRAALLGLYYSGQVTRKQEDGGYQRPGCWSYRWHG